MYVPSLELGLPHPFSRRRVCPPPPPGPKGRGAHSPAAKGVGESQFQRLEKRLALCLLCVILYHGCRLSYPYDWRGFVGAKNKTRVGLIVQYIIPILRRSDSVVLMHGSRRFLMHGSRRFLLILFSSGWFYWFWLVLDGFGWF